MALMTSLDLIYDALDAQSPSNALKLIKSLVQRLPDRDAERPIVLALGMLAAIQTQDLIQAARWGRVLGHFVRPSVASNGELDTTRDCPITGELKEKDVETLLEMGEQVIEPLVLAWKAWGMSKLPSTLEERPLIAYLISKKRGLPLRKSRKFSSDP